VRERGFRDRIAVDLHDSVARYAAARGQADQGKQNGA
jgi:hypothetical protein